MVYVKKKGETIRKVARKIMQMDLIIHIDDGCYIPANDQTHVGKLLQVDPIILL